MKREEDKILNPELIVRYLLGEALPENQQAEIERRLFADDEFLEEIQAIELQLMARYLRNDLSPREHELFESHFLLSQERRNALEFVRGLAKILDSGTQNHGAEAATHPASSFSTHSPSRLRRWPPVLRIANIAAFAAIALVLLISATVFWLREPSRSTGSAGRPPITVFIADFTNNTGDTVFNGTLEPIVKIALESTGFITAYDRTQLGNMGPQAVSVGLDERAAQQIASRQGGSVVVSGSLNRLGNNYLLSIKAAQATGESIRTVDTTSSKEQVLVAATKLAASVRQALGDESSASAQGSAMKTLTATPLEAVHEYATAMDALSNGKPQDALRGFSKAINIDPNFGLAYAAMARAAVNLGQEQDAENYLKQALSHLDLMTEFERYRTRGFYYFLIRDYQKCAEEYGVLISKFPSDGTAHSNLALCWSRLRDMSKALKAAQRAVEFQPLRPGFVLNLSVYASYAGDFQTGEREARQVIQLDPSYAPAYNALAFAQIGQGQLAPAAETYGMLEKMGKPFASSDAAAGLADLALYEGRFADAVRVFEQGVAADVAAKYSDRAAAKLAGLAYTHLSRGQKTLAVTAAENALASSKAVKIRFLTGRILAAAGNTARAQGLAADLASEPQREAQAYAKLIEGEIDLANGELKKAIEALTEANKLVDTWIGRFDLGRAYLEAGAFAEADSEFDQCIKRRGEALALFLDESPTYGYFPLVYYYLGRVREGFRSPDYAESYRTYLLIRGRAAEDPLLSEVRKRIGS
jgi:tetratricopeptide (TPR) repeat protein